MVTTYSQCQQPDCRKLQQSQWSSELKATPPVIQSFASRSSTSITSIIQIGDVEHDGIRRDLTLAPLLASRHQGVVDVDVESVAALPDGRVGSTSTVSECFDLTGAVRLARDNGSLRLDCHRQPRRLHRLGAILRPSIMRKLQSARTMLL